MWPHRELWGANRQGVIDHMRTTWESNNNFTRVANTLPNAINEANTIFGVCCRNFNCIYFTMLLLQFSGGGVLAMEE